MKIGYPDFETKSRSEEIETVGMSVSLYHRHRISDLYIVKFPQKHFGISKSVAQTLQGKWVDDSIITSKWSIQVQNSKVIMIKLPEQKRKEGKHGTQTIDFIMRKCLQSCGNTLNSIDFIPGRHLRKLFPRIAWDLFRKPRLLRGVQLRSGL